MRQEREPFASPALTEMLARDGVLDEILEGRGLTFDWTPPPAIVGESFHIPPPDWDAELAERERREQERQRQERDQILKEELARLAAEDEHAYPKPKQRRWRKEQP